MADFTLQNNATISNSTSGTMKLTADSIVIDGDLVLAGDTGITIQGNGDTTVSKSGTEYTVSTPTITGSGDTTVSKSGNNYTISSSSSSMTIAEGTNGATTVTRSGTQYTITSTDTTSNQASLIWLGYQGRGALQGSWSSDPVPSDHLRNNGVYPSQPYINECYCPIRGGFSWSGMGNRDDYDNHFRGWQYGIDSEASFELRMNDSVQTSSDKRLKKNIKSITNGLEIIRKVNPCSFLKCKRLPHETKNPNPEYHEFIGYIAQEIMAIPEINKLYHVITPLSKFNSHHLDNITLWQLDPAQINVYTMAGIKELDSIVQNQQKIIETQNTKIAKLEADISAIKSHLGI